MTSLPGADDHLGALTDDERAALAAWADDGDVPDGFEDRVVAAYLSASSASSASGPDRGEAALAGPRAAGREGRVVRLVGLGAAIAAAAAVMLMVRVLPRASEVELEVAEAREPSSAEPTTVEPAPERPSELAALGADAALVLAQHCVPCHDSTDPEAKPAALQVFDLQQPQWWLLMSDPQLDVARERLEQLEAATDDDRRKLDAFLAARRRVPTHSG